MSLDTTGRQRTAAAPSPPKPALPSTRMKERRRPFVFALMAALVASGALLAAYAFTSINDTRAVLVLAEDVARGEVIEAGDLRTVQVGVDPALHPIAASRRSTIEGQRASRDLWAGSMLTEGATTASLTPRDGESIVGIRLTPASMPTEQLYAGDRVRIVATPGDQGEVNGEPPAAVAATVVGVSEVVETGETVVDVVVPHAEAAELAARAATGRVALVLDARER